MKATFPLGRWAGIPIGAHWSVLFTVFLLADLLALNILPATAPGAPRSAYWSTAVVVTALFVASLLAHELAHATLARRFGVRVKSITLWMLGGAAMFEDEPPTPRADALIAGIGPGVSAALGVLYFAAATALDPSWLDGLPVAGLVWLAIVNLLLAGFNLLPAAPLDGGRLLRALLWKRSGDRERAAGTAGTVGQAVGAGLIGLGIMELLALGQIGGLWLALIGWFVTSAAASERAQALVIGNLRDTTVGAIASPHPVTAAGWWTIDAFLDHLVEDSVRHRVFPVVDFNGTPVGVVSLQDLLTVRPDLRHTTRVQAAAQPLSERNLAVADEALVAVLRRAPLRPGRDAIVVLRDRQLAAIVTEADLARTLELARLGRHIAASQPHLS